MTPLGRFIIAFRIGKDELNDREAFALSVTAKRMAMSANYTYIGKNWRILFSAGFLTTGLTDHPHNLAKRY
ncbi:MAG: hypothetical protein IBX64_09295 [Actinobacteria bacterium]|nr:hypothetical protein [Actinomycetota bacterium]